MLFKPLPDPADRLLLSDYLWGEETIVVHDRVSSIAYSKHTAPISLKTVLRGRESYNVHGFFEAVAPGEYLVTNGAEPYESRIESSEPTESLCIFFSDADLADIHTIPLTEEQRLDNLEARRRLFEFQSVKKVMSPELQLLMNALPGLHGATKLRRQHHALALLAALVRNEDVHWRPAHGIAAARASTRRELFRRCSIGKAYIDAHYRDDIGLGDVARAAGLSRAHFLRSFAQSFGETPHQALRRRRLQEAESLLRKGKQTIAEVALAVGYEDFSAFSRAFRSFHGVSPSTLIASSQRIGRC